MVSAQVRFEDFELDLRSGELHRDGSNTVRFPEQPFRFDCCRLPQARKGETNVYTSTTHSMKPASSFVSTNGRPRRNTTTGMPTAFDTVNLG